MSRSSSSMGFGWGYAVVGLSLALLAACADDKPRGDDESVAVATDGALTATLQNGANAYTGTADTYLNQSAPNTNYGAKTTLYVDGDDPAGTGRDSSALLFFDLSSIPPNAVVSAASLTLWVTDATAQGYPIYASNRAWLESQATWNRAAIGAAWQSAGAQGAADRDPTLLATLAVSATGSRSTKLNASGIAKLQDWIANPSSNFGFVVASTSLTDKLAFASSETNWASRRPKLSVTYTVPECIAPACCTTDTACNDGNACTNDACVAGACDHTNVAGCCLNDSDCTDDGNPCTSQNCVANVCTHPAVAGCCLTDAECGDANACTADSCTSNACQHADITGCCNDAADCTDGNACTADTCSEHTCGHDAIAGCCLADADCNDGNTCTTDACVGNVCTASAIPGCCLADVECTDGNACTSDACVGNQCGHAAVAGCCNANSDCNDGNDCTADLCTNNACANYAIAGCCRADADCADANVCTVDACVANQCTHATTAGCCTTASDCNDGNVCTADVCANNVCAISPIAGCCNANADCADGNVCTTDACAANQCGHAAVPGCCSTNADCNDGNVCTADACVDNVCVAPAIAGCCLADVECADGNVCTADACIANQCGHAAVAGCCNANSDCNDGNACTADACVNDVCVAPTIAGCCLADVECADGNVCTSDSCVGNQCGHAAVPGCCSANSDCNDGNACTADACVGNVCTVSAIAGCCLADVECVDTNICTADACVANQCTHTALAGCCAADSDCNDSDPCTTDRCQDAACAHALIVGGACGCNVDADCSDAKDCTVDACVAGACSNAELYPGACGCQSDAACDDGDPCTTDKCNDAVCANTTINCSDGDPASTDQCVDGYCTHSVPAPITQTFRQGENGYLDAVDTKIVQDVASASTNFDTAAVLVVDGDDPNSTGSDVASLLKWGNLGIPADAVVTGASITIHISGGTNSASATAYQIYALSRAWTSSEATWENADAATQWFTAGALDALDRDPVVIGTTPTNTSNGTTINLNAAGVSKVQQWVSDPTSNFGVIIANSSNTDGLSLQSSESATVSYRPMLSVTYAGRQTITDPVPANSAGNAPRYGFFVYSDSHVDAATNPVFSTALGQMTELKNAEGAPPIVAAMSLGDHTESGLDDSWDFHTNITGPYWDAAATSFGGTLPRYIGVPGNHDVMAGSGWYTIWAEHLPGQAALAGSSSSAGVYFNFTYENAVFVGLDTNKATNTSTSYLNDPQIQMLRSTLSGSTSLFKFMFYHMPAFYCSSSGGGATAASVAFVDLAAQYNVDTIFNGHSHVYTRTCRMTKSHTCTGTSSGTVQVEVGTVGATDARLRSLRTSAQSVTGYDASGVSSTASYTCSSAGGYAATLGSQRTFCYVNVRGCWANVKCYLVGNTTPFDSWTLNHCP